MFFRELHLNIETETIRAILTIENYLLLCFSNVVSRRFNKTKLSKHNETIEATKTFCTGKLKTEKTKINLS